MKYEREIGVVKAISRKRSTAFPQKLEQMLKSSKHQNSICWSEDGTQIIIKNQDNLNSILPEYFKTDKLSSFNRQLNIFGFKRTKNDINELVIRNPNFTRDQNQLKIIKKLVPLTLITEHEQLKEDMSAVLIQQQKLQQQFKLLTQIQAKIQSVQYNIFKVIICYMKDIPTSNSEWLQSKEAIFKVHVDTSQRILRCRRIWYNNYFTEGTEVLRAQIDFLQFCLDDMAYSQVINIPDQFSSFSPLSKEATN